MAEETTQFDLDVADDEDLMSLLQSRISSVLGRYAPESEFGLIPEAATPAPPAMPINPEPAAGEAMVPEGLEAGTAESGDSLVEFGESNAQARHKAARDAIAYAQKRREQGGVV